MLLQGMEGGWVVIEASHTVRSGLNVTCHMLIIIKPFRHASPFSFAREAVCVFVCLSPRLLAHEMKHEM